MRFKNLDAYPTFNWHIGGGSSPYENLLYSIYGLAVWDVRTRLPGDNLFETAASFLMKDPYGVLNDDAKKKIAREIECREWERKRKLLYELEKLERGKDDHGRKLQ